MALETGDYSEGMFSNVFGPFDSSFDPAMGLAMANDPESLIPHLASAGIPPPGPEFTEHFTGKLPQYAENFPAKFKSDETGVSPLPQTPRQKADQIIRDRVRTWADQQSQPDQVQPTPIKTESIKPAPAPAPASPDEPKFPLVPAESFGPLKADQLRAKGQQYLNQRTNPPPEPTPEVPTSEGQPTAPLQTDPNAKPLSERIETWGKTKVPQTAEERKAAEEAKKPTVPKNAGITTGPNPPDEKVETAPKSKAATDEDYDKPGRSSAETDPRFANAPGTAEAKKEETFQDKLKASVAALSGVKAPARPPIPALHPYGIDRPNPIPQSQLIALLTGALGGSKAAAERLRLLQAVGK